MSSSLREVKGIGLGNVCLEVFRRAGFQTVESLVNFDMEDQKISDAINDYARDRFQPIQPPKGYTAKLRTMCVNLVNSFRYETVLSPPPPCFICPLSLELFHEPVIAPSGVSYEKYMIEEWLSQNESDPLTRNELKLCQLYPNRHLKDAIDDFKKFYQKVNIKRLD